MAEMNFGGVIETVVTSKEFSLEKAREVLKDEVIAVIGYGVQGPGQACNLRDRPATCATTVSTSSLVSVRVRPTTRLSLTVGYLARPSSLLRRLLRRVLSSACCSLTLVRCSSGPPSSNI